MCSSDGEGVGPSEAEVREFTEFFDDFLENYLDTAVEDVFLSARERRRQEGDDENELDDEDDEEDDHRRLVVSEDFRCRSIIECALFLWSAYDQIVDHPPDCPIVSAADLAGCDFWYTRNGHGAGFWDGDWPAEIEDDLTELARSFKGLDLYITGRTVYCM